MNIYALFTSQPRPDSLSNNLPCDGGSFGVNKNLILFGSSLTHSDLGKAITQNIGSLCPAFLLPISRESGYIFCGSDAALAWLDQNLPNKP